LDTLSLHDALPISLLFDRYSLPFHFEDVHILSDFSERKKGYGIELMKRGIEFCNTTYSNENIRISAQQYLLPFYRTLGFCELGDVYLEDNIPHMEMLYTSAN
jgi:predicted GNAT family N-acyltransferase